MKRDLEVRVVQSEGKRDFEVGLPLEVGAEMNPRGRGKKSEASEGRVLSCRRKTSGSLKDGEVRTEIKELG